MVLNKKTIIISGLVLFIMLVAVLALIIFKQKPRESLIINTKSSAELELEKEKQNYDDYQKQLVIVYGKNVENCKDLGKADKIDECVYNIAVQANSQEYCNKISDEKLKTDCLNSIDFLSISWGDNPNLCETISGAVHLENCYQEYFSKLNDRSQCDSVKIEMRKKQCADIVNKRLGTVFAQPAACDLIIDPKMKESCKNNVAIAPKDSDNDGLPDDVEISYGTNPFKADTDGDGVSDYEEINTYHTNPRVFNSPSDFKM